MSITAKSALRLQIKSVVRQLAAADKKSQSDIITQKILSHSSYRDSKRISIYLSTEHEVNTLDILKQMFADKKEVFVPTYRRNQMKMLKIRDLDDYDALPMTKWLIKQPNGDDADREDPMLTSPLDLILVPGVAFTLTGSRCGHGMGYYDEYFSTYFDKYAKKNTVLIGLAFREQIVDEKVMPFDDKDYPLDMVMTSD